MKEIKNWKFHRSELGPNLGIFKVRYDHVENLRNHKMMKAIILESNDAANVVAITKDKKIVMVRQLRFGITKETIELPGGFVDEGEDSKIAALRELREETGYTGENWTYLGEIESNPAFMKSMVYHWLAREVELKGKTILDDGENVEVLCLSIEEIKEKMKEGLIQHPHTLSALARVFSLWEYPEI